MKIAEAKNFKETDKSAFSFIAVLKSSQVRKAKNGADFMIADFSDNSGSLGVTLFSDSSSYGDILNSAAGDVFEVFATSGFYLGKFSPRIDALRKLPPQEVENRLADLVEVSPEDPEKLKEELSANIDYIPDEKIKNTELTQLEDAGADFFTSTAAIKMHHAYVHGLLEHTVKVARLVKTLCPLYPFIDAPLAVAGAILHDIGKVLEYAQGLAPDRTRAGILQGHVVLGYRIVRKAAIKSKLDADATERLEHIILSHQGELEWGAATLAATPEAVLVSLADNLDAKMGSVQSALSSSNAEFSEFNAALQTRLLLKPRKPEAAEEDGR